MLSVTSGPSAGRPPFFPLTVEHLNSSAAKSSTIKNCSNLVGWCLDLHRTEANIAGFTVIPMPFTSCTFDTL